MTTNLNGLKVLLTEVVSQEELAATLEQLEYDYTQLSLRHNEASGPLEHIADGIYWLRLLRMALQNKEV